MKKKEKKSCIILSGMVVAAIIAAVLFIVMIKKTGGNTIIEGANIMVLILADLQKQKHRTKLINTSRNLKTDRLLLNMAMQERNQRLLLIKLGFEVEDKDYVDKAYQIGKKRKYL